MPNQLKAVLFRLNLYKIGLILGILLLTFLDVFLIKVTPEIMALQFALVIVVFTFKRFFEFLKDWIPFTFLFLLSEYLRGFADDFAPLHSKTLFLIYNLESTIFHPLPTVFLQRLLSDNPTIVNVSLFFYGLFFYYSILAAFIIWVYKKEAFGSYIKWFLLMLYVGVLFYLLIPTAPPWYISDIKNLGIIRLIWDKSFLSTMKNVSIYKYFITGNEVAAFPSFHAAWPTFTSVYLYKLNKKLWPLMIFPLGICFAIVFTGEHYLIDAIAGTLLGVLFALKASSKFADIKKQHLSLE